MFNRHIVIVAVVGLISSAQADTIIVPGGAKSIQAAIDAAMDGDEIVVAPGTYFETIDFLGKAITVRSSDGADVTIIDAQGADSVVTCDSGEGPKTVLDGFTITGGDGGPWGGGMRNSNSSPTVTNCTFIGNETEPIFGGGGGMANLNSSPTVAHCTFTGNLAGLFGGGMVNISGQSSPTVTHCTFIENTSNHDGGGMMSAGGSPVVTDCMFIGNTALITGGGMFNGGSSSPSVTNCTFDGNSAQEGGGAMYNFATCPTVANCTFSGNTTYGDGGGGIFNDGFFSNVVLIVANSILWDNSPNQIGEIGDQSKTTVLYSDVQGDWPGLGNIDADPLFVDPDIGDYRLSPGSPCIDAANNNAVPNDITTDLDGNPRFRDDPETPDTGNGKPPVVDMGAYEFQPCFEVVEEVITCHPDGETFTYTVEGTSCTGAMLTFSTTASGGAPGEELCFTILVADEDDICCTTQVCVTVPDCSEAEGACQADLDSGGTVDILDLLQLLGTWGPCPGCPADLNSDGTVDIFDLLELIGNWGPCP